MELAWLPVALLAFFQAVALVIMLVLLRRINRLEAWKDEAEVCINKQGRQMLQLHRESVDDLDTFSRLSAWIGKIEERVSAEVSERIEEVDMELQAHLEECGMQQDDDEEDDEDYDEAPTVSKRASSNVRGPGRGQPHAAARRRRV